MRKILSDMERIQNNKEIAESYFHAYDQKSVEKGSVYDAWRYAPHATY